MWNILRCVWRAADAVFFECARRIAEIGISSKERKLQHEMAKTIKFVLELCRRRVDVLVFVLHALNAGDTFCSCCGTLGELLSYAENV